MGDAFEPGDEDASTARAMITDGTVVRRAGWWSPAVQVLLGHLADAGFRFAPRPLGVRDGWEVVSYIPGDHGAACWTRVVTDDGILALGQLLRTYHRAVASFVPPPDARWKLPGASGPGTIICHGDFAPWNVVWNGSEPVGIVDWEFAHPGHPFDDLAWLAIWTTPLRSDEEAVNGWDCWSEPPDRRHRLDVLLDAYGAGARLDIVDRAVQQLHMSFEAVRELAGLGLEPQRSWVADGSAVVDRDRAEWIIQHRQLFEEE